MTNSEHLTALRLAEIYRDAVITNNVQSLRDCFAEGAIVWHNFDGKEVPFEESLEKFVDYQERLADRQFDIHAAFEAGHRIVVQSTLRGTVIKTDQPIELHNCFVFGLDRNRVTRFEEYIDPRTFSIY